MRRLLKQHDMSVADVELIEMNPPDMPAALYAGAVAAYATGEPFGAVAEKAGYARPLYMTRDVWPNYICCVLTVREELIQTDRALVQQLVNYVMGSGAWLDASQANRSLAADIAAGPNFFNQKPDVLKFVLSNPPDRVTYGDLRVIRAEFEELVQISLKPAQSTVPSPTRSMWTRALSKMLNRCRSPWKNRRSTALFTSVMTRFTYICTVLMLLGGSAPGFAGAQPHVFHGIVSQSPPRAADFTLTAHTGQPVRQATFKGN